MAVNIRPLHPVFVGEVEGVDLRQPLGADEVAAIVAGMDRYAVLVFHDQDITDEQQLAFTRNFGPLEEGANSGARDADLRLPVVFADVSNLDKQGRIAARDNKKRMAALGNRLWHSDASFRATNRGDHPRKPAADRDQIEIQPVFHCRSPLPA